ncbi:MAG: hypothetical protein IPN67_17310 [Bacteroidales bacterium]|nr:hypothetical protein [Bacteroidales bacterium]
MKPGFIILILTFSVRIFCQETKLSETIVSIAEDLAASEADQEAASAYIDRLYELAENPADLNSTDQNEISRLFFLTDFQIKLFPIIPVPTEELSHSTNWHISPDLTRAPLR